jgi:broad specificity phosphatase PhoE
MELVLVRHARPRRLEVDRGRADPSLDEEGRRQADALAAWWADAAVDEPVDALYTSPLARARETAAPLATALGLEPVVLEGVAEWDRDARAYIPIEELPRVAPETWAALVAGDLSALGVDLDAFLARLRTSLHDVASAHPGQRVVVVCHGGVVNAFLADVLGLDRTLFFAPDYTSVHRVLVARDGRRALRSVNETAHLRRVGPSGRLVT